MMTYIYLEREMATLLWYSCLENPLDRGAWWATIYGVARVGHDLVTKPPPYYYHMTIKNNLR